MKKWDLALESFNAAANNILYRTPHFAYNNMGLVYYNKGDYQNAIGSYKKALELAPDYSPCYENLARAYEAIEYDPGYPASHFNLAKLYLKLNRAKEADRELKLTIEIDPKGRYGVEAMRLLRQLATKPKK